MITSLRILIIAAVLFILYYALKAKGTRKRNGKKPISDLSLLKPHKVGIIKYLTVQNPKEILHEIVKGLNDTGPFTAGLSDHEALLYIPDPAKQAKENFVNIPVKELPVRIILKITGNELYIQIDEDYKTSITGKNSSHAFREKYKDTFHYYLRKIESSINRFELE